MCQLLRRSKRRRAHLSAARGPAARSAAALATRNRPFPKTIGEGLTYLGKSLSENYGDRKAAADEAAYRQQSQQTLQRLLNPGSTAAPSRRHQQRHRLRLQPVRGLCRRTSIHSVAGFKRSATAAAELPPDAEKMVAPQATQKPEMPLEEWKARIARNESGMRKDAYTLIGPPSRRGDHAYGKYQVMGENIPKWTKQFVPPSSSKSIHLFSGTTVFL